jgi:hypothetical protein
MFGALSQHFPFRDIVLDLCLLASVVLAWFIPRFGDDILGAIERFGTKLAQRRRLAILLIALFAIVVRLSLLRLVPVALSPGFGFAFSTIAMFAVYTANQPAIPPTPGKSHYRTCAVPLRIFQGS